MVLHRAHTMDAVKNNFMCSTYKKKGKEVCSGHYIREVELSAVLLDDIRRITHFARQNELRFTEYIGVKQGKEAQREIAALQKLKDSAGNVSRFLENARKYTEIPKLTCEILHTFIQRVEVGERTKRYDRNAPQEIRIYYRDIGLIDEMPETMAVETKKHTQAEVA